MHKTKIHKILPLTAILALSLNSTALAAEADNEGPPSINIVIPSNSSCTENSTAENDSKLCQNGSYITCDSAKEETKSKDGSKVCKSSKWVTTPNPSPDDEAPPSLTIKTKDATETPKNDNPQPSSSGSLEITKADAYPKGFNPTVTDTKITYEINKEAIIEVKINNSNGETVGKLVEDKKISAGEYFVNWKGTANNEQNGTILPSGTYEYKILAKDSQTGEIKDTADGEINLIYFSPETTEKSDIQPAKPIDKQQVKATQALNNANSGKTAKTGPGLLIYSIFPIIGYFISRKKNHD